MSQRTVLAAGALFLWAIALAGGCSSTSTGEKMVESYARTKEKLVESQQHIDATLATLRRLRMTQADGLKDAFREYKEDVARLEKDAKDADWRARSMKEESDAHIQAWQSEMSTIKDPSIKASLQSRREAARTNFTLVQMYADDVRKTYKPFLQGNQDIVRALSIDLSRAALTSLAPAMDRVTADGEALKIRISMMQRALDNIANGISPLGQ